VITPKEPLENPIGDIVENPDIKEESKPLENPKETPNVNDNVNEDVNDNENLNNNDNKEEVEKTPVGVP
jgi:hypothetical protein